MPTVTVQAKAREITKQWGVPRQIKFKASRGWAQRFMKRYGFSLRWQTAACQKPLVDFEKLIRFQRFVIKKTEEKGYRSGQIANADQTFVYCDMPIWYTVNEKGDKKVNVRTAGYEKQRAIALPCCSADGYQLLPYILLNRKPLRLCESFPPNIIVRANKKGWMTSDMVVEWTKLVWLRLSGALLGLESLLVSLLVSRVHCWCRERYVKKG